MKKVLFVLTSHNKLGDIGKETGCYLPEVTVPYHTLVSNAFKVDFMSPQGGKPPLIGVDLKDKLTSKYLQKDNFVKKIENTLTPDQVDSKDYAAIYFAGGHGTMWDLPDNEEIAYIVAQIYQQGGIVAAVCHGPAGLVNVKLFNGKYLVEDKTVACYSNEEEKLKGLEKVVPFLLESKLKERGAVYTKAPPKQENVEVCERLITGQNPASSEKLAKAMVKLLKNRVLV